MHFTNIFDGKAQTVLLMPIFQTLLAAALLPGGPLRAEHIVVTRSSQVALGALLFNEKSLSSDETISCSSCHQEKLAFSDGLRSSEGVFRRRGTRNAPSLLDVSQRTILFWDGRRASKEDLVLDPILGHMEQGLRGESELLTRIRQSRVLNEAYARAFGRNKKLNSTDVRVALSSYLDTLRVGKTPFQQFAIGGDADSLSFQQQVGYRLFIGRAGCAACHLADGENLQLTDDQFHNRAVGEKELNTNLGGAIGRAMQIGDKNLGEAILTDPNIAALGRFVVTHKAQDIGAFRTPSLYNVAVTAPYMHDGSIETLKEAIDHEIYYSMSDHGAQLSQEERSALVAFLQSLTSIN